MNESILRNCGLVVIDDELDAAEPLLFVFRKKGIPCFYYDGEENSLNGLPESPLERVRFVFVDLVLSGYTIFDHGKCAAKIAAILQKIMRSNNGPYALIYWSKHSLEDNTEFEQKLAEYCNSESDTETKVPVPVVFCDMDKSDCYAHGNALEYIHRKLSEKLKEASALQLYVEWERIVAKSATECVKEFSDVADAMSPNDWQEGTGKLFGHLCKAFVGQRPVSDDKQRFRYASQALNRIIFDRLEHNVDMSLELPEGLQIPNVGNLDSKNKSRFNAALFISYFEDKALINAGDVFAMTQGCTTQLPECEMDFEKIREAIKARTKEGDGTIEITPWELIFTVVTPGCDLAQEKCPASDGQKLYRGIYGLLRRYDTADAAEIVLKNLKGKKGVIDAIFREIQVFYRKPHYYVLIFDFHTLTTLWSVPSTLLANYLFSFKNEILHDLQSKAASHVNRIGHLVFD